MFSIQIDITIHVTLYCSIIFRLNQYIFHPKITVNFLFFTDIGQEDPLRQNAIGDLVLFGLIQGLHCGDLGEVKFTTLCSSTYPYFVALLLTFKLHNSTYPFTQSVSVDVTCDVSDVNSIFFRIHSITCRRADCKRLCCCKVTVQTCKFFLLQFLCYIGINV